MFTGIFYIFGVFLPYIIVPWAESKLAIILPESVEGLKEHILIYGYNEKSLKLYGELKNMGITCVIMDSAHEKVKQAIENGVSCVLSDGGLESFIKNGIEGANALIIVDENIEKTVEILITLKNFNLPKIVVIDDAAYTRYILYAGASRVLTPKNLVAAHIARKVHEFLACLPDIKEIAPGVHIAETTIRPKSSIEGKKVGEYEKMFDLRVISLREGGKFYFRPPPDKTLNRNAILLTATVGADIRSACLIAIDGVEEVEKIKMGEEKILLIGYGEAGKVIAKVLSSHNYRLTVVDLEEEKELMDNVESMIVADVLDESFWRSLNLEEYSTAIISLPKDSDSILCSIMLKKLSPKIAIFARCNDSKNVQKFYNAGSHYVADLQAVSSMMVMSHLFGEIVSKWMVYKGVIFNTYTVEEDSKLAHRKLKLEDIEDKFGCILVCLIKGNSAIKPDTEFIIEPGTKIVVAGLLSNLKKLEKELKLRT